ncbi:hypothetical protein [Adhaeretor mobilis]|uniref:Uncharacterized protein n=1 Tax=Adhaeretor mobilis TaxID=1930276 RepID=A0A517MTD6_9BACT|nr:hypothetical protein [Adhaeretor mobilis]QDS98148.1 hypothetical protein HG15A2_14210 [Adhaeretor mobilis]
MSFVDQIEIVEEPEWPEKPSPLFIASAIRSPLDDLVAVLRAGQQQGNYEQTSYQAAYAHLTNTLKRAKPIVSPPQAGYGLVAVFWRFVVQQCKFSENLINSHQGNISEAMFRRDAPLETFQRCIDTAMFFSSQSGPLGPSVDGLLDSDANPIEQLREVGSQWVEDFRDEPVWPSGFMKIELLNKKTQWDKRRNGYRDRAERLVLQAIESSQIRGELYADDGFVMAIAKQLGHGSFAHDDILRSLNSEPTGESVLELADWLAPANTAASDTQENQTETTQSVVSPEHDSQGEPAINPLLIPSLLRNCRRLEAAAQKFRSISVLLVHRTKTGSKAKPYLPEVPKAQGKHMLTVGGGPSWKAKLREDSNGVPLLDSQGQPQIDYPGAQREYYPYGVQFPGSSEVSYSESLAEYWDASNQLGQIVQSLPKTIRKRIWKTWPYGYQSCPIQDLWTNVVFELGFQADNASGLVIGRKTWHLNKRLPLAHWDDSPPASDALGGMFNELIDHVGNPPNFWYAWIENIWQASIVAIDLLSSWLAEIGGHPTNEHSNALQILSAEQQARSEDRARKERESDDRYETIVQPYDAAWNALDGELWSRDAARVVDAVNRLVETGRLAGASQWLAWLPESNEVKQDPMSRGIALAIAGTLVSGGLSRDDAAALITMMGETHPRNNVERLRRERQGNSSSITTRQEPVESIEVPPADPPKETDTQREVILDSLTPAVRSAYASFKFAESKKEQQLEDRPAYDWLKEHGCEDALGLADYSLPAFATYTRYLSKARNALGEQKYSPRAGRESGSSIVREDQI